MKTIAIQLLISLATLYMLVCSVLYFFQEKLIFFPEKLGSGFTFRFNEPFEELTFASKDNLRLHAVLFHAPAAKGLIFYLHGNAGSVNSWGQVAGTYTALGYDVFMPDYRGFGKSEGKIRSQAQLFQDAQLAYDAMKLKYDQRRIVVLGYSIGTGLAAKLASTNHPRLLILQAPYYSLTDLVKHIYPVLPTFILKYKLETNQLIPHCDMPIVLFHGDQDEVIYYGSSLKLKKLLKKNDTLVTLSGQGHNGITENREYRKIIKQILSE